MAQFHKSSIYLIDVHGVHQCVPGKSCRRHRVIQKLDTAVAKFLRKLWNLISYFYSEVWIDPENCTNVVVCQHEGGGLAIVLTEINI